MSTSTSTARTPLTCTRIFSTAGKHPFDELQWELRDVVQKNWKTDEVVFEQTGVEFPVSWSLNASTIVTTKYFRGALGTPQRESSLKQLINRVVGKYVEAVRDNGYFASDDDVAVFGDELTWLLVNQYFSFNSPVWFNVGTASPQQVSACFILSVDDSMDSILNWYREEGLIFKGGSGAGLNLSRIRSSKELLSSGGTASGPVSFMRGADASAGTIKSGGATRRAAKMVVLDVDHPDIVEFIETKAREEDKIRALRDAGFDMDLGGKDIVSVQYQNANNSVRVSDEFMQAVESGESFGLRSRTTGEVIESVDAKSLFRRMAEAAWACADPGIQYDGAINGWHTSPNSGRITASNPCSEFLSLDNSSCNLASLNLVKFRTREGGFDTARFVHAIEIIFTAMDASICFGEFPTEAIAATTRAFRQLGIGYSNLGVLLMAAGLAYDSPQARGYAAAITALMTATSYRRSAEIAAAVGAYDGYFGTNGQVSNAEAHTAVMERHAEQTQRLVGALTGGTPWPVVAPFMAARPLAELAQQEWQTSLALGATVGWRNAQASLLAPTGTISFMMDCDTTGIEPDFALLKFKKLVGGGSMQVVNQTVPLALESLGYGSTKIEAITSYIAEHGHVIGAPHLQEADYDVFDCAIGERAITADGHIHMMAACQPFLSGAISKTVNLPESATVEDVERIYFEGWQLGLKAIAVYRDQCKVGQPLSSSKDAKATEVQPAAVQPPASDGEQIVVYRHHRERLPQETTARRVKFEIGGQEGYIIFSEYPSGALGEIFIRLAKPGTLLSNFADALAMGVSVALQYGAPLETFVEKFAGLEFAPKGRTNDPDVRIAESILDFVFRKAAILYLDRDTREMMGILTPAEKLAAMEEYDSVPATAGSPSAPVIAAGIDGDSVDDHRSRALNVEKPMCPGTCGTNVFMQKTSGCWACTSCGVSAGCS